MLKFHECARYLEELNSLDHNTQTKIIKKLQEYKKRDNLDNLGNVEPLSKIDTYILKVKQPSCRIIIQVYKVNGLNISDEKVYFIRDIISNIKFDREYGRILYSKIKKGEWLEDNPLPNDEIEKFKETYKKNINVVEEQLEYPPAVLSNWFNQFNLGLNNEIFESEEWVSYALNNSVQSGMRESYTYLFRAEIENIINARSKPDNTYSIKYECNECVNDNSCEFKDYDINIETGIYINNNIGIICSRISIKEKEYFLLHNGAHIEEQNIYWAEALAQIKKFKEEKICSEDDLYKYSFRSYPKWTLKKEDLWYRITKSEENSNLSLTTEQVNFLKNFKFPRYINGRAGSGKSTLLYYIFSNVIFLKSVDEIKGNILFLTENEQLLNDSYNNVIDLLENNAEFGLGVDETNKCDEYFNSFKDFLLSLLDAKDLKNFKNKKYLHFPLFKKLYESSQIKSTIKNSYSAEEAWFVITTYIYGHDINKRITSETYEEVVRTKSQKISLDRFKDIETHIIPFYENLLQSGYWDKLKIIRYINENINFDTKPKYDVIICDEAQDFCRVELRFILQQSSYLGYDLSQIDQIPIVFAGDANQTVNPTGFSDAEMTSLLYRELNEIKFQYSKEENFYSTNLNYRSNSQVVDLANFIQYYRIKKLELTDNKRPQESKRTFKNDQHAYNIFIDYETIENTPALKSKLIEKLKFKVFIIPTNTEEKSEFIKKNSILNSPNLEIKTSVESKGAEYKQVVLYGFGDFFLKNYNLNDNHSEKNQFKKFEIMYYFNKLYVAITRAKTELIIIDSKESEDSFWKKLVYDIEVSEQNKYWHDLKERSKDLILYNPNSISTLMLDSTKIDALENAKEDEKLGINYQNSARLKIAASQYQRLGKEKESFKCLALAEEIDENYLKAADYFEKSSDLIKASDAYFKGRFFKELLEESNLNLEDVSHEVRVILSRLMLKQYVSYEEILKLENNKKIVYTSIKNLSWRNEFIREFISFLENNKGNKDFRINLIEVGNEIGTDDDIELFKTIANIQFEERNYKEAIETWEMIDIYTEENYYVSKYEYYKKQENYQNQVIFLYEIARFKESISDKKEIYYKINEKHKYILQENISTGKEYNLIIFTIYVLTNLFEQAINQNNLLLQLSKLEDNDESKLYPSELYENYKSVIEKHKISKKMFNFVLREWFKLIVLEDEFKTTVELETINEIYKKKSAYYDIEYSEYTLSEVNNIIENNDKFEVLPSKHIENIEIKNFRQFKSISLKNLGKFNVIVGDNNVGKTSLLESLLFSNDQDLFYKNLAYAYIARNNSLVKENDAKELKFSLPKDFIIDFFRNNSSIDPMEFKLRENREEWKYSFRTPTLDEVMENSNYNNMIIDGNDFISLKIDKNKPKITPLLNFVNNIKASDIIKMQLIPFGKGFDKNLAISYYESIDRDRQKRKVFLDAMKVFIPNIDRIMVDTNSGKIEIEEFDKDGICSLSQYGEGANKLFRILVQITIQKNQKLLVDEIDAGIHFSHFKMFWEVILKVASENDVQLFITTHNIECIDFFKDTVSENTDYQDLSKIITLVKLKEDEIKAYTRSFSEFEFELDNEFEIRGGE